MCASALRIRTVGAGESGGSDLLWLVVMLNRVVCIFPNVISQFVAADNVVFPGLGCFEVRVGCLTAHNADIL
jgi:hypothetical protein